VILPTPGKCKTQSPKRKTPPPKAGSTVFTSQLQVFSFLFDPVRQGDFLTPRLYSIPQNKSTLFLQENIPSPKITPKPPKKPRRHYLVAVAETAYVIPAKAGIQVFRCGPLLSLGRHRRFWLSATDTIYHPVSPQVRHALHRLRRILQPFTP